MEKESFASKESLKSMKKNYDIVFLSNFPAFYKLRLYNRIAEQKKIFVVFLREQSSRGIRNADFCAESKNFEFKVLPQTGRKEQILAVIRTLKSFNYNELVIGGWDELPFWAAAFCSPQKKNAVVVESSYLESTTTGVKAWIKRIFFSRISKAYCSGASNIKLVKMLGFRGNVVKTGGVGLYRRVPQPAFEARKSVKNFLYVGRLSPEKNLEFLIRVFEKLPELTLNIVGFGPQEMALKSIAGKNVVFHGPIPNAELLRYYRESDVFVLPSKSEPWGMVVEEALNNGVPVLLSNRVGCAEEILGEEKLLGLIFDPFDEGDCMSKIRQICGVEFYNRLRKNVSGYDSAMIEQRQVNCYG